MLAKSSDPEYCGVFINEVRMIIPMFSFCHRFSFNESTTIQHTVEDNFEQKNVLLEQSALISRIMKNRPNSRKNSNESLKLQPYIKKRLTPCLADLTRQNITILADDVKSSFLSDALSAL